MIKARIVVISEDSMEKSQYWKRTKIRLLKYLVWPVVSYGCEGWTRKSTDDDKIKQELSYCKQIARQLRTQYVGGIYNPVTLKSNLRVTQGHWKRNHWIDHTRLTISRVV